MSIFNVMSGGKAGYELIEPPTVTVGTYTYNGSEQGPIIIYATDTENKIVTTNATKTAAGTYTLRFSILNSNKYVWSDGTTADKTYQYTINQRTVTITAPTVNSSTLTYNGNNQTISGSTGSCTIGGTMYYYTSSYTQSSAPSFSTSTWSTTFPTAQGKNAGTYYIWYYCYVSDTTNNKGTNINTALSVSKTINKKASTITLSKSSITLDTSKMSDTFTVTYDGDGTLTSASSSNSIATVSPINPTTGATITVSAVANGTATITISGTAGTNYSAPTSKTVTVTVSLVANILNDNTWATISSVSSSGSSYWSVGDRKSITVNGSIDGTSINQTLWVYILGFNHKNQSGITFGTFKTAQTGGVDVAFYAKAMNSSSTNSGGWKNCRMRYNVLGSTNTSNGNATSTTATNPVSGTMMAAFPSDLRAVMKPMTIYSDNTGGGSDTASYVTTTVDYLPLLAEFEVFGATTYANSAEKNNQAQYQYYINGNSKVKRRHDETGSTCFWWLRSVRADYSSYFCLVHTSGIATSNIATYSNGVAPAFLV